MSMPKFPEVPDLTVEDSVVQIISSIAMEELALSHIINAEGEKLQYVLGTLHSGALRPNSPVIPPTIGEILEVNESVKDMLSTISMNQMFLLGKLSAAMNAYSKLTYGNSCNENGCGGNGCGGGGSDTNRLIAVTGHILEADVAGDSSDWLEIARYNGYSLIVRENFLNIYPNGYNDIPSWQHTPFGSTNVYSSSKVRTEINNWFQGTNTGDADNLADDAKLRNFTVKNTALAEIGSGPVSAGFNDGFSKPIEESDRTGLDVAFALSYGEAANYISEIYALGGGTPENSSQIAQDNFKRIEIPKGFFCWLRSPGISSDTASSLEFYGRVFHASIHDSDEDSEHGLVYPALWVDSRIFNI
ncbi:MAG: hypothetical protein FWF94_04785 [Oscillospiraceae bacterium]|nr:hypothetical protein [Oscillospiraceae bacterium]